MRVAFCIACALLVSQSFAVDLTSEKLDPTVLPPMMPPPKSTQPIKHDPKTGKLAVPDPAKTL